MEPPWLQDITHTSYYGRLVFLKMWLLSSAPASFFSVSSCHTFSSHILSLLHFEKYAESIVPLHILFYYETPWFLLPHCSPYSSCNTQFRCFLSEVLSTTSVLLSLITKQNNNTTTKPKLDSQTICSNTDLLFHHRKKHSVRQLYRICYFPLLDHDFLRIWFTCNS